MKIVRTHEMEWGEAMNKGSFFQRRKQLGGQAISSGLYELPPGKKSFPFHAHHVTEEAMFVIAGSAKVRTPDGLTPIGAGDYLSFPPGGAAHQLINDGNEPMIYLAISASKGVDIVEYPDSNKVSSSVGNWPDVKRFIFKKEDAAGYFDDEKDAE
jgi:uncharacterized cupin superfamily protein